MSTLLNPHPSPLGHHVNAIGDDHGLGKLESGRDKLADLLSPAVYLSRRGEPTNGQAAVGAALRHLCWVDLNTRERG